LGIRSAGLSHRSFQLLWKEHPVEDFAGGAKRRIDREVPHRDDAQGRLDFSGVGDIGKDVERRVAQIGDGDGSRDAGFEQVRNRPSEAIHRIGRVVGGILDLRGGIEYARHRQVEDVAHAERRQGRQRPRRHAESRSGGRLRTSASGSSCASETSRSDGSDRDISLSYNAVFGRPVSRLGKSSVFLIPSNRRDTSAESARFHC